MLTTEFDFWHKGQAVIQPAPSLEFNFWHKGQAVIMLQGAAGAGAPITYRPPVVVND